MVIGKILILSTIVFALAACNPRGSLSQTLSEKQSNTSMTQQVFPSAKADWEQQWNKAMMESKKESTVVVYTTSGPEIRVPVGNAFRERYGIPVEFVVGKGAEVSVKILSERKAGIYLADVYIGGATTVVNSLKPAGLLDPIEKTLILPEVIEPQNWYAGKISYIDNDRLILYFIAAPWISISVNSDLVKNADINSWWDILNARWKGKIAYADPTLAGASLKDFGFWSHPERLGVEYFKQLAKQEPFIGRDDRQMVEGVARGKFAIGVGLKTEIVSEFKNAGASIVHIVPKEGTYMVSAGGNVVLINRAPHPNAARVFINWLLTKEGQTAFSRGYGFPSARVDVPIDHVDPQYFRNPSVKYFWADTEEFLLNQPGQANLAREIFGPLIAR